MPGRDGEHIAFRLPTASFSLPALAHRILCLVRCLHRSTAGNKPHPLSCLSPAPPRPVCRPQAGECLLQAPVDQLASQCAANQTCVAFLLKPGGIINGTAQLASLAYFKSDANPSKWILTPTTIMFVEDAVAAGSSSGGGGGGGGSSSGGGGGGGGSSSGGGGGGGGSSGGGLSGGAIAGIVVGAVAVAAAAAAAAWAAMRRRRAATNAAAAAEDGKSLGTISPGSKAAWQGGTDGLGSPGHQDSAPEPQPLSTADDAMLSPFGLVSAAAVSGTGSRSSSKSSSLRADAPHQSSAPVHKSSSPLLQRVIPLSSRSAQRQQQPGRAPLPAHQHSAPPPQASAHLSASGPLRQAVGTQPRYGSTPLRPVSTPRQHPHFNSHSRIAEGAPLGSSSLPSAMLSAGLSAALPPGSSVASSALGMSSCQTQPGGTTQCSSASGPDVLVEVRALAGGFVCWPGVVCSAAGLFVHHAAPAAWLYACQAGQTGEPFPVDG